MSAGTISTLRSDDHAGRTVGIIEKLERAGYNCGWNPVGTLLLAWTAKELTWAKVPSDSLSIERKRCESNRYFRIP